MSTPIHKDQQEKTEAQVLEHAAANGAILEIVADFVRSWALVEGLLRPDQVKLFAKNSLRLLAEELADWAAAARDGAWLDHYLNLMIAKREIELVLSGEPYEVYRNVLNWDTSGQVLYNASLPLQRFVEHLRTRL